MTDARYAIGAPGEPPRTYLTTSDPSRLVVQLREGEVAVQVAAGLPRGVVITPDGLDVEVSGEPSNDDDRIRQFRTALLSASDWTQIPDAPLGDQKRQEWATYRQALRDLPESQSGLPFGEVQWPEEPH